ncbi:MAG: hypothetical protein KHX14_08035 [[Clostridium] spiroforme]|uniref:Uncharacterized protein n=1 Tax=Thomasclavelia spiroformis TaxID=29348 RepID=A0A943EIU1_9FIRM|nr:hypothetical protein [Thomasclavelia spiroformis]MBS5588741.1 hypothetical protein [Thomasclavelia spiroformis]
MKRKLMSFFITVQIESQIILTLFKEDVNYVLRIEYLYNNDKIKETNFEIDKDLVYWMFYSLKAMIDQVDYIDNNDELAYMKVYYEDNKYLGYKITRKVLDCFAGVNDVIKYMTRYIDDNLNQRILING